jgi:hypothetical protein
VIGRAWFALAAYLLLTIAATWPLATGLTRDVAWDLGDPVLNMWILSWDVEQLRAILGGDVGRVRTFFDANIFHPAPLTLAYSEHLIPQAIQALPIYLLTDNPILAYNLIYLSTFVLSGLGMYLFVRELTGNAAAAFIAGLIFAFTPYRVPQSSHLQVLSSQWMPFALYGLRRYFDTGRLRPLAGGMLALVVQGLSCGYYLLYFTPFAVAYACWEIWQRRLWRQRRTWIQLTAAGLVATAIVAPLLWPYAAIRTEFEATRSVAEVTGYSADVYSYATASPLQRFWGPRLQTFPKAEGELFPGLIPLLLALIAVAIGVTRGPAAPRLTALHWLLAIIALVHGIAVMATLLERRIVVDLWLFTLQMSDVTQLMLRAAFAIALLLALSPGARARAGAFMRGPGFFLVAMLAAMWLSLGLAPQALGRPLNVLAPYRWLYDYVPGFEGVRVPARFVMIALAMLAVLAGMGATAAWRFRATRVLVSIAAVLAVLEGTPRAFQVNELAPPRGYAVPETRVYPPAAAPPVYQEFARRAAGAVLAELPLGVPEYDLRAVYYSTVHWRPILNGYSGFFPPHYGELQFMLSDLPRHPELSLAALKEAGATHVIVHEGAFLRGEGPDTSAALIGLGSIQLYRNGPDILLELPEQ